MVYKPALYTTRTQACRHLHTQSRAEELTHNVCLKPEYGIQVSSVYHMHAGMQAPTHTHMTKPVAVELRCHATALIFSFSRLPFCFRDDSEVAVIYFRAGYIPDHYITDKVG